MSRDVGIEAAIAVGDDVQAGHLLVSQVDGQGVQILLAVTAIDHRLAEITGAEVLRVPARPRQRADDAGRQNEAGGRGVHQLERPSLT